VKRQYIYSSIEDSEIVFYFERKNKGLKKLCQILSEQKSDSSASLTAMCLLKYVLNCENNFFIFRSGLSGIRVKCNRISEGLLLSSSKNSATEDVISSWIQIFERSPVSNDFEIAEFDHSVQYK
jgi:hypothetical protein